MSHKSIALVAHDSKKSSLIEWAKKHASILKKHPLFATGSTGIALEKALGFKINKMESGPLGGDQQLGSKIVEGKIDMVIFFWDPLESLPHDPDVRALLRIAVVWNVPIACNESTADYLMASPLFESDYKPSVPDYTAYRKRTLS